MNVSIITVCYNSVSTIEDTINSIGAQDYPQIEHIIIDGDSTDGTQRVIEKYKNRIQQFISEPDEGIYDAMNKGIELATGDVIGILNSDDVYSNSSVISKVMASFVENDAQAVYADLEYVDKDDLSKVIRYWKSREYVTGDFYHGWMPAHPTFFLKKSCYIEYGHYLTDFRISADYELMLRMIEKHQIRTSYLPESIVKMRVGGESNVSLKNRWKANREDRKAWLVNDMKPGPLTLIKKPIKKIDQFWKKPD